MTSRFAAEQKFSDSSLRPRLLRALFTLSNNIHTTGKIRVIRSPENGIADVSCYLSLNKCTLILVDIKNGDPIQLASYKKIDMN